MNGIVTLSGAKHPCNPKILLASRDSSLRSE